jgi:hypothetical protein
MENVRGEAACAAVNDPLARCSEATAGAADGPMSIPAIPPPPEPAVEVLADEVAPVAPPDVEAVPPHAASSSVDAVTKTTTIDRRLTVRPFMLERNTDR